MTATTFGGVRLPAEGQVFHEHGDPDDLFLRVEGLATLDDDPTRVFVVFRRFKAADGVVHVGGYNASTCVCAACFSARQSMCLLPAVDWIGFGAPGVKRFALVPPPF